MKSGRCALAFLLSVGLQGQVASPAPPAPAEGGPDQSMEIPAIVRIRVLDGEGGIQTARTRSAQPIVVFLSDEGGRPVAGAAVSARLPDDGATGVFASGMRTEIAVTGKDGRAAIRGIVWGPAAGAVPIRITASKGDARAGIVLTQYVTESAAIDASRPRTADRDTSSPQRSASTMGRSKWIVLAVLAGGAAAGGVAAVAGGRGSANSTAGAPAGLVQSGTVIGAPIISVVRP